MEKRRVGTMGKLTAKALLWFFHGFFLFLQFLIFIGEWTQKITVYPFIYLYNVLKNVYEHIKAEDLSLPKETIQESVTIPVHTIKINYERVKDEDDKKQIIQLPDNPFKNIKLPKISFTIQTLFTLLKTIDLSPFFNKTQKMSKAVLAKSNELKNISTIKMSATSVKVNKHVKQRSESLGSVLKQAFIFITGVIVFVTKISFRSVYIILKEIFIGVVKIPVYIFYILKELVYYVYSILSGVVLGIISFYRYITSPYFRSFLFGFIFCVVMILSYQAYLFVADLPSPTTIGKVNFAQSTHLFDRNGKMLYEIYRDVNRTYVDLGQLPSHVIEATIAIEDKNFYQHRGISFFGGILRAARETLKTNELQGGSTITQQLVKSALLTPERTVERKLKEIILAVWTEQIYTKDEILEMYLNQVPYGGSAYGIEEASKVYLGKSAKQLTLSEAALLAGLPQAPSLYSPFINPELALKRRNDVLRSMQEVGYISQSQKDLAMRTEINILNPETNIRAPHFVFYTRSELEKEFGMKQVEEGGFRVTTTLDLEIQNAAQQILREELAKVRNLNITNGGIVVLNPRNGEILAMVGSVDYFIDSYGAFNVTTALRQPGSALKPMLYAMALERGYTASTPIDDSPIIFNNTASTPYRPVNYDGKFHGRVTVRHALANSFNIPAVKTLNVMGVPEYIDFAKNMGIDTWRDPSRFGLALSLGGGETTLIDLAQVYAVFASGGYRIEPVPFSKIIDSKEREVTFSKSKTKVLDPGIAYIISDILSDNNARKQAFGSGSALEIPGRKVSVKTGTTDDKKDNLTVGYTPEFVVAVWVGNNDNTSMNPQLVSGITGAAPIWNKMMTYLLNNKAQGIEQMEKPENVIAVPCGGRTEYFLIGTERNAYCSDSIIKPKDKDENKREARNTSDSDDEDDEESN